MLLVAVPLGMSDFRFLHHSKQSQTEGVNRCKIVL
jgi:hypothetical protein